MTENSKVFIWGLVLVAGTWGLAFLLDKAGCSDEHNNQYEKNPRRKEGLEIKIYKDSVYYMSMKIDSVSFYEENPRQKEGATIEFYNDSIYFISKKIDSVSALGN